MYVYMQRKLFKFTLIIYYFSMQIISVRKCALIAPEETKARIF